MKSVRFAAIAIGCALLLASGSPSVRADFVNGSFEDGDYSFDGNGAASLPVGSTTITGWTTFGGELAVIRNANAFGLSTPFGDHFIDLAGYHDSAPYGGVEQSIATVVGGTYVVSLYLNLYNGIGAIGPDSVTVTAGGSSEILSVVTDDPNNVWLERTFTFVAQSTSTLVQIQGNSSASGNYIGLDNVSITGTGAVPEPSSVVMLGLGGLGMLGYARARKGAR